LKHCARAARRLSPLMVAFAIAEAGCSIFSILPDNRTPTDKAREFEPRCRDFTDGSAARLFSPGSVDSVEPAYSFVQTGNDRRANLRGARIHVKPLPGLSPEAMTRTLECHQVGVVLRGDPSATDDPYSLPGRWLDFDVSSEADGFVVLARVTSIDDARVVLDRAKHFAADRTRM
jgi:hypothetical protein